MIETIILNNCNYITEKGINQLITANNNVNLSTLQVKGIYRNLGCILLYDVNNRKIKLILDKVAITYANSHTESIRYAEVIRNYLLTHSEFFEQMKI